MQSSGILDASCFFSFVYKTIAPQLSHRRGGGEGVAYFLVPDIIYDILFSFFFMYLFSPWNFSGGLDWLVKDPQLSYSVRLALHNQIHVL